MGVTALAGAIAAPLTVRESGFGAAWWLRSTLSVLVAIGILAVALPAAFGSGARGAGVDPVQVFSSGSLIAAETSGGGQLSIAGMAPGQSRSATIRVSNTGSAAAAFSLAAHLVDGLLQARASNAVGLQQSPELAAIIAGREHEQFAGNELIPALLSEFIGNIQQLVQIVAEQHLARRTLHLGHPVERTGQIDILDLGTGALTRFLDLSSQVSTIGEGGLLGLALLGLPRGAFRSLFDQKAPRAPWEAAVLATVFFSITAISALLVASPRRVLVLIPLLSACAGAALAWVSTQASRPARR